MPYYINLFRKRGSVVFWIIALLLLSGLAKAQAQIIDDDEGCSKGDINDLKQTSNYDSPKARPLIVFEHKCEHNDCFVSAKIMSSQVIVANFKLNTADLSVCREKKHIEITDKKLGCAKLVDQYYLYIAIGGKREDLINSTLVFEITRSGAGGDINCAGPDINDGPSLATFVSTYRISPQVIIFVYELDDYNTVKASIDARPLHINP